MIMKPNDYEMARAAGEWKPLSPGGYALRIMEVKEEKSKAGNDMIVISLDVAEGPETGRFAKEYREDRRERKHWGCVAYRLLFDEDGLTDSRFKGFVVSVERSNPGFHVEWGEGFCHCLKGKLVGGVFRREQYEDRQTGELKWSTKCYMFRDVDTIRAGVDVPEDKPFFPSKGRGGNAGGNVDYKGFEEIDGGALPF